LDALQKINSSVKALDNKKKLHGGKLAAPSKEEAADSAAEIVQNRIRGILARKEIEDMRQEEMIFLGMVRKPKTDEEILNDPMKKAEETRRRRKD